MSTVHVYPVGDLVDHDRDGDDCPCGPRVEPVPRDDGSMGWLITHHSLDGRELHEPGHSGPRPPQEPGLRHNGEEGYV